MVMNVEMRKCYSPNGERGTKRRSNGRDRRLTSSPTDAWWRLQAAERRDVEPIVAVDPGPHLERQEIVVRLDDVPQLIVCVNDVFMDGRVAAKVRRLCAVASIDLQLPNKRNMALE